MKRTTTTSRDTSSSRAFAPFLAVAAALMTLALVGFVTTPAAAQARPSTTRVPVNVTLRPHVAPQGAGPDARHPVPHQFLVEVRLAGAGPVDLVADRRLLDLRFTPEGSRRSIRCRHPDAPRTVRDERVRTLDRSAPGADHWAEVIDLRMYCWRGVDGLARGGRLEGTLGFARRASRNRWITRAGEARQGRLELAAITVPAAPLTTPLTTPQSAGAPTSTAPAPSSGPTPAATDEPAIRVELRRVDRATGDGVMLPVTLRGTRPTRVYLRDDLLRFRVVGPLGEVECAPRRQPIVPIIDFYRRVDTRRAARTSIEGSRACPDGTFDLAGIYEVTPIVDLVYDGSRYDLEVATGTFEGEPTLLRVRRGGGYVERPPNADPDSRGPDRAPHGAKVP